MDLRVFGRNVNHTFLRIVENVGGDTLCGEEEPGRLAQFPLGVFQGGDVEHGADLEPGTVLQKAPHFLHVADIAVGLNGAVADHIGAALILCRPERILDLIPVIGIGV